MQTAVKLAGFFAAHSIWCVCEGETLVPILAVQKRDGTRELRRMESERLEDEVKGALIDPYGNEVVPVRKIRRHYDIHNYGFS